MPQPFEAWHWRGPSQRLPVIVVHAAGRGSRIERTGLAHANAPHAAALRVAAVWCHPRFRRGCGRRCVCDLFSWQPPAGNADEETIRSSHYCYCCPTHQPINPSNPTRLPSCPGGIRLHLGARRIIARAARQAELHQQWKPHAFENLSWRPRAPLCVASSDQSHHSLCFVWESVPGWGRHTHPNMLSRQSRTRKC